MAARQKCLYFGGTARQPFFLATLPVGGKVRRISVEIEGRVVDIHLVTGPIQIQDGTKVSKNAVVVSPGRLDRCPCGTGTSALLALLYDRGELAVGERFLHRSILETEFECRMHDLAQTGAIDGIIPQISGRAWLTGVSHYGVDPDDPFPNGYRIADTWFV